MILILVFSDSSSHGDERLTCYDTHLLYVQGHYRAIALEHHEPDISLDAAIDLGERT